MCQFTALDFSVSAHISEDKFFALAYSQNNAGPLRYTMLLSGDAL